MKTHAMIDIETLGTGPDAVVLSVGAVKFSPYNPQEPHAKTLWKPNIDEQTTAGRSVLESTLEWWAKQPKHIQDEAFSDEGRITVKDFMGQLNKYLVGVDKIWCQGPQFDMVILENLYGQFEHHTAWAYWKIMDCRTIFNMMPVDPRKAIQQNLHSADADAYYQAVCVQQTYKHFNVLEG
jgi:exodeoxyribonuclease VIII